MWKKVGNAHPTQKPNVLYAHFFPYGLPAFFSFLEKIRVCIALDTFQSGKELFLSFGRVQA
jgi:hypothetical protein